MFSEIVMPILVMIMMFGMGIALTRDDFRRLFKMPKSIFVGLFCQILALPILGFIICKAFGLPNEFCIGLMIIAACPGGTVSNIVSQLSKANLPLSISLTAFSTFVCIITAPLVISFASGYFATGNEQPLSVVKVSLSILVISVVPVALGIAFHEKYPEKAKRLVPKFEKLSQVLLALAIVGVVKENYGLEIANFSQLVMANITLNVVAIAVGVGLAIFMGLSRKDAFTVGIEAGIQNSGLAIIISLTVLENPVYAATAIVYGVVMTGIALTVLLCRKIQVRYSFA